MSERNWPLNRSLVLRGILALGLLSLALVFATRSTQAVGNGQVEHLPIADFLDAQGTQDVWYPPEPALFAWTGPQPDYPRMAYIDYVGAADRWLVDNGYDSIGTEVSGTFTRRMVGDNLAEYSVIVHATNTLAWCVRALDGDGNWDGVTLLFGSHVDQVAEGAEPALGKSTFKATWRQDADEPIADINLAANYGDPYRPVGWELRGAEMRGTANGPLHAAAGLGPDGTPGKLVVSQTNSNVHSFGRGNGNGDGFPAEVVNLKVVGP